MANKINFVTGETYTLAELFSGERSIIIPDLQRDYCWGDAVHTDEKKELVSGFVQNLFSQFEQYRSSERKHSKLSLGIIYGYEVPAEHIQLCDGQQRLTTLYLLIGMLNKRCKEFRRFLISDYEYKQDDKEPYLNYAIRETSLYFLSDLVCRFFIEDADMAVQDIKRKKPDWYFNGYDQDPSIQSMLRAMEAMERLLSDKSDSWCTDFGYFILQQLTFMYYDMGSRENGEETFVVINTTGEPLSATQNLKPLVIQAAINTHSPNVAGRWEDMETWFWKYHRSEDGNDTAESGFREFLSWVEIAECEKKEELQQFLSNRDKFAFQYEKIPFDTLESYFDAVRYIFESKFGIFQTRYKKEWLSPKEPLSQIDGFRLWPVMCYIQQVGIEHVDDLNLRRFYEFIKNLSSLEKVKRNPGDYIFEALQMSKSCVDVVDLLDRIDDFPGLMSAEEREKLTILKNSGKERHDIEQAFWHLQGHRVPSHRIWAGEIGIVIDWSKDCTGRFYLDAFKRYEGIFDRVFTGECKGNIDLTRRALISLKLTNYPLDNYSFGCEWEDWKRIISGNPDKFKTFFDMLLASDDIIKTQQEMIDLMPEKDDWSEFAKCPYLLEYCDQKHIAYWHKSEGWMLCKRKHAEPFSVRNAHLFYALGNSWNSIHYLMGWKMWPWSSLREGNCVVFDEEHLHIFINVSCRDTYYIIQIGRRSENEQEPDPQVCVDYLRPYIPQNNHDFQIDKGWFTARIPWDGDYEAIINYVTAIISYINSAK